MARQKKKIVGKTEAEIAQASLDHFEREKKAYEERTGTKVEYVPPTPLALMPKDEDAPELPDDPANESDDAAGSDDQENKSAEGVE